MKKPVNGPSSLRTLAARDIMSETILSVTVDAPLKEAIRLFIENHVGAAPVFDAGGKPAGVITKTDLVRRDAERRGLSLDDDRPPVKKTARGEETVGAWMTPFVLTVAPEDPVGEVARLMVKNGVHHVFVKKAGALVGVISGFDVLRLMSRALNAGDAD